jgi:hypothetical protein
LAYDSDPEGNNISLYFSNNLTGWTPYSANPILSSTNGSFYAPTVAYTGGVFEMFLNNLNNAVEGEGNIERWTSANGTSFTYQETVLTSPDDPWADPFVWLNPNDGNWYLFWVDGNNFAGTWTIYARDSSSITGLGLASDTLVMSATSSTFPHMSGPTIMYRDGHYWLLCEVEPLTDGPWEICAFVSTSVTSGYGECPNSPILTTANDVACPQIFIADDNVSCYLFTNQDTTSPLVPPSGWYQEEFTVYIDYYLTVETSPPGVNSPNGTGWYDANTSAPISTPQDVDIISGSSRYDFRGWTTTGTTEITNASAASTTVFMDENQTVTADYVTQYMVTFDASSNVKGDSSATIVTVNGTAENATSLPYSVWVDDGSSVAYSFASPVASSSASTTQYRWNTTSGLDTVQSDNLTVTGAGAVTGNYVTQYDLEFAQSGLDSSAQGTIVSVTIGAGSPVSLVFSDFTKDFGFVDAGTTITYTFTATVSSSNTGEQFVLTTPDASPASGFSLSGATTVTGTYKTQYLVSFTQSGISSDAGGNTVLTLGGVNYAYDALPSDVWVDNGTTFSWASTVAGVTGERFNFIGDNAGLVSPITAPGTDAATYGTQYQVTFDASSNVKSDSTGTIVTVGGSPESASNLPYTTDWINSGSLLSWSFSSPVASTASPLGIQYRWNSTSGLGQTGQSGSLNVTAPGTIVGVYVTQYQITFGQTGVNPDFTGTVVTIDGANYGFGNLSSAVFWWDSSSTHSFEFYSPLIVTANGEQYVLVNANASSPYTVSGSATVTGTYKTQYYVTFAQTGVGVDFIGSVMNVSDVNYTSSGFSGWINNGTSVTFNYYSPLVVTANGEQYVLTGVTGNTTASSLTVSGATTVTGAYQLQYYVTFAQSGVGVDFSGTVMTVNGVDYGSGGVSFWADSGNVSTFNYASPLVVSADVEQYVLTGVSGNSTDTTLTVAAAETVTGSYVTQYYVTFNQFGVGSDFAGTVMVVNGTNYDRAGHANWYDSGASIPFSFGSPLVVTADVEQYVLTGINETSGFTVSGAETVTGAYKTQFYVTVTSVYDSPTSSGWVDEGANFTASVTSPANVTIDISQFVCSGYIVDSGSLTAGTSYTFLNVTSAHTIEFDWTEQFYVTFIQSGVGVDFSGNVMNVSAVNYTSSGFSGWFDSGASIAFNYYSPLVVTANGEQYVLTGVSGNSTASPLTILAATTVTGAYQLQYYVTFAQSGVGTDFTGSVMNVNGTDYNRSGVSSWFDSGASVPFSYYSPLNVNSSERYALLAINATSPLSVSGAETVTGSYITQYYLTVATSPSNVDSPSGQGWYNASTLAPMSTSQYGNVTGASRYNFTAWTTGNMSEITSPTSPSTTVLMDSAKTVTANYVTQFNVTFNESGVSVDFTGTVVTIDSTGYNVTSLPASFWWDNASVHTFTYDLTLLVTANVKQYVLVSTNASSPYTVSGSATVTGTYETQWYITVTSAHDSATASAWVDNGTDFTANVTSPTETVANVSQWVCTGYSVDGGGFTSGTSYVFLTVVVNHSIVFGWQEQFWIVFNQSGVGSDYSANVMTVNGTGYGRSGTSFWANADDAYNFSFSSPLIVTANVKQYVFTGANESSPFTVSSAETVTGNYSTQWYVTFAQSGVGVDFSGSIMNVSAVNYTSIGFSGWFDSGAIVSFNYYSPLVVTANGEQYVLTGVTGNTTSSSLTVLAATTVTGAYQLQYYVTFAQSGVGTDFTGSVMNVSGTDYDRTSVSGWYDNATSVAFSYYSPLNVNSGERYVLLTVNETSPLTVSGAETVTGTYVTQYYVTFSESGLDGTATGTVVTVNGSALTYSGLPYSLWVNNSDSVVFGYANVSSNVSGERFTIVSVNSTSPLVVTGSVTVTGSYVTQYLVSFTETGLDSDAAGTVLSVGGTNYVFTDFNVSNVWVDNGVSFSWTATVSGVAGEQFVLTGTSGLASPITTSGTSSATYKTQYQVSFVVTPSSSGSTAPAGTNTWQDEGNLSISALANPGYMFLQWSSDTGSITFVDSAFAATTTMINGPGNITAVFAASNATLAVRGENDMIYYRTYNWSTSSWGDWNELPAGSTTDTPATAICGGNQYFIVRGEDGYSLWFSWINLTDGSFSGWTWISGSTPSTPTLITNGTALILVVRGSDNTIYYRIYDVQTQTWNDWVGLPAGTTCDKVGAAILGDTLQLVVRGFSTTDANINDTLWYSTMNLTSGTFSGWTFLPGSTPSTPILSAWGSNNLTLVVRGDDNTLYINTFNGTSWQGWTGLSSGSTLESPAATVTGDTLIIVVVGMDGNTLWQTSIDLNTSSFSGWTWITGSTPSPPILTS